MEVVVQHGCEQIVRGGYRMDVSGKMQVDIFHRDYLAVSSSGRTSFDAEAGSEGRLAQTDHGLFTYSIQGLSQTDRVGGFAFSRRGWGDGSHQYQFARRPVFEAFPYRKGDLGFVLAVKLDVVIC